MTRRHDRLWLAVVLSLLAPGDPGLASGAGPSLELAPARTYERYDVGRLSRVEPDSCWLFRPSFGTSGQFRYRVENVGRFGDGDSVVVTGGTFEFGSASDCGGATTVLHANTIQSRAEFDFGCGTIGFGMGWECMLFHSERFGLFECWDSGDHEVGEHLQFVGAFVPGARSPCMMGPIVRGTFYATCAEPTVGLSWGRLKTRF